MTQNNSERVEFYRDSRRPQGWGGFFLAIWMAIYIGGVVPLWIIAVGALTTMLLMAVIIVKFRPLQLAATWDGSELVEKRFILPPKHYHLDEPPTLIRYEDDIAALQFTEQDRLHEVYFVFDEQLSERLQKTDIKVVDQRDE
ncbi:hypothetical protein LG288_08855 [Idiomarina seosinensis]|uniref:hypothetical protein n=1 Tax=Idiomarina seosinensis TaxID=281739 RepID=UPI003850B052